VTAGMYRTPLVPGPTTVPPEVLAAFAQNYPSGDLEPEYCTLYAETQARLQTIFGTGNRIALMSGEAMVGLWGALKSCVRPGDRVLAVAGGLFGHGFAEMARAIGADVRLVESDWDDVPDVAAVEQAAAEFRPHLVTMVHGETPSGTIMPVGEVGAALRRQGAPLFLVDAVATAGGTPVETDAWGIDLLLVGSQKALSAPPDMAIVAISERAFEAAEAIGYQGYDALSPWRTALARGFFPYTPNWHGTAALHAAAGRLLDEGLERVYRRHADVAAHCRERGRALGLEVYPRRDAIAAPTVTAFKVPPALGWEALRRELRARGVGAGGNYGPLAGKVFRLGHMGTQADRAVVDAALATLAEILRVPVG